MSVHYLLWATGEDRQGIVAAVSETLYRNHCNIEDSSMMRLGGEFGILLIFSSTRIISSALHQRLFKPLEKKFSLSIGMKPLTLRQSRFHPVSKPLSLVTVHGVDRPGIVYHVTRALAKNNFNITDLSTHRTTGGKNPGFILFIEGESSNQKTSGQLRKKLLGLQRQLKTKILIQPIPRQPL